MSEFFGIRIDQKKKQFIQKVALPIETLEQLELLKVCLCHFSYLQFAGKFRSLSKRKLKIIIYYFFILKRIPIAIIFIIDFENKLPMSAHAFTNLPAHLNSALNPIFYGIFNPIMREGYRNFINKISCNLLMKSNIKISTSHDHSITKKQTSHSNLERTNQELSKF